MKRVDVERLCREAIARGADPVALERAKAAAIAACGGSRAEFIARLSIHQAIDEFEDRVNRMQQSMVLLSSAPFRRIVTEQDKQDLLRGYVQAYPEEIAKLLEEIHPRQDPSAP